MPRQYPKALAEFKIRSHEEPINILAVAIIAFETEAHEKAMLRREMLSHLIAITGIREVRQVAHDAAGDFPHFLGLQQDDPEPMSSDRYKTLLYDDAFCSPYDYLSALIAMNKGCSIDGPGPQIARNQLSLMTLRDMLVQFHSELSKALEADDSGLVESVVNGFG